MKLGVFSLVSFFFWTHSLREHILAAVHLPFWRAKQTIDTELVTFSITPESMF